MSIYKRKSGRYAVLIDVPGSASAPRVRRSLGTFATKREAKAAERQALIDRDAGAPFMRSDASLGDLWDALERVSVTRGRRANTHRLTIYARGVCRDASLLSVKARVLRRAHVDAFAAKLVADGYAPATVRHVVGRLAAVLAYAVQSDVIPANPASRIVLPKLPESTRRAFAPEEVARIVAAAKEPIAAHMIRLAVETGLRRGELCGLRWADVDYDRRTLSIRENVTHYSLGPPKNGVGTVPLSSTAVVALKAIRVIQAAQRLAAGPAYIDEDRIFAPCEGGTIGPTTLGAWFDRAAKAAGLPTGVHRLRHTCGSWLLAAGVDPRTAAAILRDSFVMFCKTYAHELPGAGHAAMERLAGWSSGNRMATETANIAEKPLFHGVT